MKAIALILTVAALAMGRTVPDVRDEPPQGRPVLTVSKQILEFRVEAGKSAARQVFLVSSDQAHIAYTVSAAAADWLQFDADTGKTQAEGDPVSVRIDTETLAPGVYSGLMHVSAWRGANVPAVQVKVHVVPADAAR